MLEEDKEFDLKIRSILEDGQEEVPDYLWEAVQKRLPAKKNGPVVLWLRRSAIAVAAAAAAAAVFFLGQDLSMGPANRSGQPMDLSADAGIQVVGKTSAEETPSHDHDAPEGTGSLLTDGAMVSAASRTDRTSDHAGSINDMRGPMPQHTEEDSPSDPGIKKENKGDTARTSVRNDVASGQARQQTGWDGNDILDADIGAARRKPAVAMTISGNAIGNSSNGRYNRSFSPMQSSGIPPSNSLHEDMTTSYAIPLSFGAGVKISFNSRWAVGAGVNYSLLNRTLSGIYYDEHSTPFSDSDIFNTQSYIGIPVNVYFSILKKDFIDLYAYAGGAVEKCVSSKYLIDAPGHTITYREESRGVQMSADLGIGVEFLVIDRLGIYIDPSLRYYFKSRQPKSIRTVQPLMLGFEAGLRVRL